MNGLKATNGKIAAGHLVIATLAVFAGGAVHPAEECAAEAVATLEHEEGSELEFSVEVTTDEACADIEYDLVIEERLPNGHANLVRKSRTVTLRDGTLTEAVEHTLPDGHAMLGYEAQVVDCAPCDDEA